MFRAWGTQLGTEGPDLLVSDVRSFYRTQRIPSAEIARNTSPLDCAPRDCTGATAAGIRLLPGERRRAGLDLGVCRAEPGWGVGAPGRLECLADRGLVE